MASTKTIAALVAAAAVLSVPALAQRCTPGSVIDISPYLVSNVTVSCLNAASQRDRDLSQPRRQMYPLVPCNR
jgi:hypothetical protein